MNSKPDVFEFEELRPRLLGIAYRMLGSYEEAEDIVQEAYLRLQSATAEIRSPGGYLHTIVTRLCLDALRARYAERKAYQGIWLPEPVLAENLSPFSADPEEQANLRESISMAFLLLMESLSPEERAVFLLRGVFEYDYSSIARLMKKSEAACRQLFSRARKHIAENRSHFRSSLEEHHEVLTRFLTTLQAGNINELMSLMADDISVQGDGGGKAPAAVEPVAGREAVARLFVGLSRLVEPGQTITVVPINGKDGILVRDSQGRVTDAICFEIFGHQIQSIYYVRNPDKLKHLS
jgi:RNA polymerase sigma-70 factor, ECF subfamily